MRSISDLPRLLTGPGENDAPAAAAAAAVAVVVVIVVVVVVVVVAVAVREQFQSDHTAEPRVVDLSESERKKHSPGGDSL